MTLAPGQTFERYTIEALLGRGGMGEVYLASDPRLGRKVAIKVVRDEERAGQAASRLRREARTAAALSHPNVVAVHDVGEVEGVWFIVMEHVRGESLLARLRGLARIPLTQKLGWLVDVAKALASAHQAGIVHRDVKPSNVMISEDGVAKVVDFGLARPFVPSAAPVSFRTLGDGVSGTPSYMAPELLAGAQADAASDQFAFGVTAYELLTGARPPDAFSSPALASEIAPEVPLEVARAVARMLARDPAGRFASMGEIIDLLDVSRAALVASGGPLATGAADVTLRDSDATLPAPTERDAALEAGLSPTVESTLPLAARTSTKPLPPLAPRTRTAAMAPIARPGVPGARLDPSELTAKVPRPPAPSGGKLPVVLASLAAVAILGVGAQVFLRGGPRASAPPPGLADAGVAPPSPVSAALPPGAETRWRVPTAGSPSSGPSAAPVTVVELCDFVSPSCKAAVAPLRTLLARHGGRVRLVWKDVPSPEHPRAEAAAELASEAFESGGDEGFWKAHDGLFSLPPRFEDSDLEALARALKSPSRPARRHAARLDADANLADDLRVTSLPAFFVNGRGAFGGPTLAGLEKVVEEELALAAGPEGASDRTALARDPFEPERRQVPPVPAGAPTRGPRGARVVVQVWGDYAAPECRGVPRALSDLLAAYGEQVEVVWRDRPVSADSALAAEAAREAGAQKGAAGFWRMNERLFLAPDRLGRADLVGHARALGLDVSAFESALDRRVHQAAVSADVVSARDSGIAGTPAFLVAGYYLGGPQPARRLVRLTRRALEDLGAR